MTGEGGSDPALAATQDGADPLRTAYSEPSPRGGSDARRRNRRETASVGMRFGRYEILERLGSGGMGVVYLAHDPELDRRVALKLRRDPDDPDLAARFGREARAMAQVNHPNVVTVFDVGTTDGTTYIAMEVVEGVSLRTWQNGLGAHQVVAAYLEAGRGLAAAHSAGLVHRDFKPDNVLVGADGRARVTDFGLAAAPPREAPPVGVAPAPTDIHITTSGTTVGTPAYMSPEQFESGNVDPRTDQFSFCAALYEALYGERPFAGKTVEEVQESACAGRVSPPPRGTRVSGALRAILLRGLSLRAADRYPSMERLLADLARDRARPWRRTAWLSAAACAVLALGLVADVAARDRIEVRVADSFHATGVQIDRELRLLSTQFEALSRVASHLPALREVAAYHDQADFGLGSTAADTANLADLHQTLVSADWVKLGSTTLAIADYKGRLLYSSEAPSIWGGDLAKLPVVARTLETGKTDAVSLVSYDDPVLGAAGVFGGQTRHGLAMVYVRTLAFGGARSAIYLQIIDGKSVLDEIRLGEDIRLALVGPDGLAIGDVPPELIGAGRGETHLGGETFLVEDRALRGLDGQAIGRIVMARPLGGVLSLFPHARAIFLLAMLGAFSLALVTAVRARQLTDGQR